jgi:thioredoxin reductase (NADPH)
MSKPTILSVDDDPLVSEAITRDLRERYGADYRVARATSGIDALALLAELALRDRPVALIVADQRMPRMTGIEMLEQAKVHAPGAKNLLLTAYADTDVAIRAINDIGLDYYLLKPWDPPAERLYPVVDDLLDDWRAENPEHTSDVRVIGHRWSERSHEIKTFLARNHVPYRWYDVERDDEARRLRLLRQRLFAGITEELSGVSVNGPPLPPLVSDGSLPPGVEDRRLPGNLNLSFEGVGGEALLMSLKDIAVSSGSACTSASLQPSHVLKAIGVPDDLAHASIRFGLGRKNTAEEVDFTIGAVAAAVRRLRELAPAMART